MFRADGTQLAVNDEGVSIEFQSMDILMYNNGSNRLAVDIEHTKNSDGNFTIYADLSGELKWVVPSGQRLDAADKVRVGEQIKQGLKALGLNAIIDSDE